MKAKSIISLFCIFSILVTNMVMIFAISSPSDFVPYQLTAKEITPDETHPYGSVTLTFKINDLPGETGDTTLTWYVYVEKKIGDGDWMQVESIPSVTLIANNTIGANQYSYEQLWIESYNWSGKSPISFRVFVSLDDLVGNRGGNSAYSNVASIGLISSPWAAEEIQLANELGLIPESLLTADLTKPITREEFCELAVLLYESVLKESAVPVATNPFTDTTNPQILKAYQLGITNGVTATLFQPNTKINREQCAAMLFRDIKAMFPNNSYVISDVKDFPDQKDISAYAVEATKYMSKLGIIKGDAQGAFMPKAMTPAQTAAGFGTATREAAIIMSVRTYQKLQ